MGEFERGSAVAIPVWRRETVKGAVLKVSRPPSRVVKFKVHFLKKLLKKKKQNKRKPNDIRDKSVLSKQF